MLRRNFEELEKAFNEAWADEAFRKEYLELMRDFVGRPTPLQKAERWSERCGVEIWFKREDLAHTGAHKINNAVGQVLLARRMGKSHIIAETVRGNMALPPQQPALGRGCHVRCLWGG